MPFKKVSKVFLIRTNSLTEEHRTYRADNVTWTLDASLSPPSQFLALKLTCNRKNPSPIWKCSASISISLLKGTPGHMKEEKVMQIDEHDFKATANCVRSDKLKRISELMLPENQYVEKGQISLLLEITVSKMSGIQQKETRFNFRKPCEDIFDAMLMVEGKPVHVGRQFLSTHSQFFADLFRQNRETVHQIDAVYNEFIDFLDLIYPTDKNIKREKVVHLLKLAHRFGVTRILSRCENFAIQDECMEMADKFLLAEKYQLSKLQCQVLRGLKTSEEVRLISKHPRFNELGDATKTAIFARMIAIMDNQCAEKSEPDDSLISEKSSEDEDDDKFSMNAIEGDNVESSELFFTEDVRDSDRTENVNTTSEVDVTMAIDTSSWRSEEDDIGNVALLGSESQDATLSIFHSDDDDSEDVVVLY